MNHWESSWGGIPGQQWEQQLVSHCQWFVSLCYLACDFVFTFLFVMGRNSTHLLPVLAFPATLLTFRLS